MSESEQDAGVRLCSYIGLSEDSSYPAARQGFINFVKAMISESHCDFEEEEERAHFEQKLREVCALYFDYAQSWHRYLAKNSAENKDHVEAMRLKTEAGAITRTYQNVIIQFFMCGLCVHSTENKLAKALSEAEKEAAPHEAEIQWTYDLPAQVATMTKKRNVLSEYMVRIRAAKPIVSVLESAFLAIEKIMGDMLDERETKTILDDLTGLIRKHRYKQARHFVEKRARKDYMRLLCFDRKERRVNWEMVLQMCDVILLCVQKKAQYLTGRGGRVFLRAWEVNLAYDSLQKELEDARAFLSKYEVPEIKYRCDALAREKVRFLQLTNADDLLALYEELMKGRFFPMKTLKDVRAFESGGLKRTYFAIEVLVKDLENVEKAVLKQGRAPDLEKIADGDLRDAIEEMDEAPPQAASAL